MLEAVEAQLLRRRFANVVRLEVGAGTPVELVALLTRELEISPQQVYEVAPARVLGLAARARGSSTGPISRRRRGGRSHVAPSRIATRARCSPRSVGATSWSPSVRLVRLERGRVRRGRARSQGCGAEGDGVPDGQRVADARIACAGGGGGQAGCLPRRAEGALRRAAQYRLVADARAGGGERRLWRAGPEGARELALLVRASGER